MKSLTDLQKMRNVKADRYTLKHVDANGGGSFFNKTEAAFYSFQAGWDACEAEMLKREEVYKSLVSKMKASLGFDYDYYEAKPHKCLYLLNDLKKILAEIAEIEKGLG